MMRYWIGIVFISILMSSSALARWKSEYANVDPKIRKWYKSQHNAQGQWCCDESDGHPFYGIYTLNKDGSVTLYLKDGERVLPKHMVLTGPNPTGHAVAWYTENSYSGRTYYCFAPGTLM